MVLGYPTVSRQHVALIRTEDGGWMLYDLGSKGGVTVNGAAMEGESYVSYGDVLGLGGLRPFSSPFRRKSGAQQRERRRQ